MVACILIVLAPLSDTPAAAALQPHVTFTPKGTDLDITIGGRPFARYVTADEKIRRPYFCDLRAPNGVQVTRNHPPIAGKDAVDHDAMHPGLWLSFGDISGADFWRNKGLTRHVEFVEKPVAREPVGRFAVRNRYESGGQTVCEELCRITIHTTPQGTLIVWDSEFRGEREFAFGDQEEMGLGFRVATPLTVQKGGTILSDAGKKNEKEIRGTTPKWCSYSGMIDGQRVGLVVMPHPDNFRPAWMHARDYGLLVANPFGRNALTGGERSNVKVKQGETLRLRFGVLVFSGDVDAAKACEQYLKAAK
jgi:hypothetical protein